MKNETSFTDTVAAMPIGNRRQVLEGLQAQPFSPLRQVKYNVAAILAGCDDTALFRGRHVRAGNNAHDAAVIARAYRIRREELS